MLNIRKIGAISRTYRNLGRYRQILSVLFKYGFGEFLNTLRLEQMMMALNVPKGYVYLAVPLSGGEPETGR